MDKKTARVQLELPPRSMDRLKSIRDKTEATSYAEVLKHALQVYEDMIREHEEGGEFFVRRQDGGMAVYRVFC